MGLPGILSGLGGLSAVRWHPPRQSTTRLMPSEPPLNWLTISTPMIRKNLIAPPCWPGLSRMRTVYRPASTGLRHRADPCWLPAGDPS